LRSTIPANSLLCEILQVHPKAKASIFDVPEGIFITEQKKGVEPKASTRCSPTLQDWCGFYRNVKAALP
jgi:hypothetical protein